MESSCLVRTTSIATTRQQEKFTARFLTAEKKKLTWPSTLRARLLKGEDQAFAVVFKNLHGHVSVCCRGMKLVSGRIFFSFRSFFNPLRIRMAYPG